jgi:hypothetical protein
MTLIRKISVHGVANSTLKILTCRRLLRSVEVLDDLEEVRVLGHRVVATTVLVAGMVDDAI